MRRSPWMTATRSGWISAVRGRNPRGVSGAKFAGARPRPRWKMLPSVFAMAVPSGARRPYRGARNEARELGLPSAPVEWIKVHDDPFRPQPRLDNGQGMTTTVGRVREDNVLPNGVKYLLVSPNTRMGAAAGAVLVAEYLVVKGYIG